MAAPKLDPRTIGDVVETARTLAAGTPTLPGYVEDWTGVDSPVDPGRRAINLFARLMELLIEHENRIPEKNFLRFLDFVGVERSPGSPARAPLTFLLAKDAREGAVVPKGTQAATTQSESVDAQVFETESEFYASVARLEKTVAVVPSLEGYAEVALGDQPPDPVWLADVSRAVTALTTSASDLLTVPHTLYLLGDSLFGREEPVDVTLVFTLASGDGAALSAANVAWKSYEPQSEEWVALEAVDLLVSPSEVQVQLPGLSGVGEVEVAGITGRFIAGTLHPTNVGGLILPHITSVAGLLGASGGATPSVPDFAFANAQAIDLTKPFRPFGERPAYGDAFYLGSLTAFSPEVESVELISTILPYTEADLLAMFTGINAPIDIVTVVEWQYLRGDGVWQSIATFEHQVNAVDSPSLAVTKSALTLDGAGNATVVEGSPAFFGTTTIDGAEVVDFRLTLGSDIGLREVNGQQAYWLRAILRSKEPYGSDGFVIPGTTTAPPVFVGALLVPPTVETLTVTHTHRAAPILPATVIAVNDFEAVDQSDANSTAASSFPPFVRLQDHSVGGVAAVFAPEPALYLGLDRPLEQEFVSLFVHLDEATSQAAAPLESGEPLVSFEYFTEAETWKPLDVEDGTGDLTTSGAVAFLAPPDAAPLALFTSLLSDERREGDPALFWIRARLASGTYDRPPKVLGVYLNTVMADHHTTVTGDLLIGSGTGRLRQQIQLVRYPVLGGDLWVREPERPSEVALDALLQDVLGQLRLDDPQAELTADDLVDRSDPAKGQDTIWVRWHRVPNFAASKALSRHYTLDPVRGLLAFGDGEKGLIPPIARDNLALRGFRSGGGESGREAATPLKIKELKTSLPFVSKVFNPVRATGGSDAWNIDDVMRFGPQSIKNRGRAVTTEDYEWMVQERFGQAAKVRCLPTRAPGSGQQLVFRPGAITAIVVPKSAEVLPRPSNGLINEIRWYLQERTLGCIVTEVHVIGPTYHPVSISAKVKATVSREASAVQRRVASTLEAWLHPITGSDDSGGWAFGRDVFLSEVYAVIAAVPGVDYVITASFVDAPAADTIDIDENYLTASGTHQIEVVA